jgi:hypothetical protein
MAYPGERVQKSGIYLGFHILHRQDDREHVFVAGETFPSCITCNKDVEYILIKAAPSPAESLAFGKEQRKMPKTQHSGAAD